jgi:ADP-ribose pyrophosphatase YjhB (NUDIX family)
MHHNYIFRHCPVCGDEFTKIRVKDHEPPRLVCKNRECGFVFYLDPKLVACAIVEMDNRIVLLKRAKSPERGKWVMPGGYVDRGEKVEEAAIEKQKRSAGLILAQGLFGVYSYPGILRWLLFTAKYRSAPFLLMMKQLDSKLMSIDGNPWDELAFESTEMHLRITVR